MGAQTLLLADDEPELLEIYRLWLARCGYKTLTANNGYEALHVCLNNRVDLIISDVRMAVKNGIELARDLRTHMEHSPPLIFLTGYADISSEEAYELGACAILSKPIDRHHLRQTVQNALKAPFERWMEPPETEPRESVLRNYHSSESAFENRELNLGQGGMFVRGAIEPLLEDSFVSLQLDFEWGDPERIEGAGIVRWQRVSSERDLPPGLGVEIAHLSPPALGWAAELISRRKPRSFIPIK